MQSCFRWCFPILWFALTWWGVAGCAGCGPDLPGQEPALESISGFDASIDQPTTEPKLQLDCEGSGPEIHFGVVKQGESALRKCTLQNDSSSLIRLVEVSYTKQEGGSKQDFALLNPQVPVSIKQGEGVTLEFAFQPSDQEPTSDKGSFLFKALDQNDRSITLALSVQGFVSVATPEPKIALLPFYPPCQSDEACQRIDSRLGCVDDPPSKQKLCLGSTTPSFLKFPFTSKGRTVKRTFLIRNTGEAPLTVSSVLLDGFSSPDYLVLTQGLNLPLKLNPGQDQQVTVEYTPSDDKADTGKVFITSDASNGPENGIQLEAATKGCDIDVQPRKIDFLGPGSKQVTITNKGNDDCTIDKVSLASGKSEPFAILPPPKAGHILVPNGSLSFLVKFSPKSTSGNKDSLLIENSDPDEPKIEVVLSASFESRPCELSATPATLQYGLIPVGRSRSLSVTIENKGWGDCEISALNVLGTQPNPNNAFQLKSTIQTPLKIPGGGNIRLDVSFTPPAEQNYEGALELQSNDTQQPNYRVKLNGISGPLCLELLPPALDFGATKFGCATPKRSIEVFHLGNTNCQQTINITKVSLGTNPNSEFRLNAAPTTPKALTKGQSVRIDLSYKAKDLGVDNGTLDIENDLPGRSPVTVPLVGEGVASNDQKDVFKQVSRPMVDLMFIIDNSCSSVSKQKLNKDVGAFLTNYIRFNADYQILVTTSDASRANPGCAFGTPSFVTPQTPNPSATLAKNVQVGSSGSGLEQLMEAAYKALSPPASTGCNKGFHRKDALLHMIFLTNEPDSSTQSLSFYMNFFRLLKGHRNQHKIKASVVVGPPPQGCANQATERASASPRLWELSTKLGGVQEPVCTVDWQSFANKIAKNQSVIQNQFSLSRQADPSTIQVKVNGSLLKQGSQNGWSYDTTNNMITFSDSQLPPPNSTIEIQYKALCLP